MRKWRAAVGIAGMMALAFWAGRISLPTATIAIERSHSPGWIEVYVRGELQSEWHETKDPDIWPLLDKLLRDAPELYKTPKWEKPEEGLPGRGPILEQASSRSGNHRDPVSHPRRWFPHSLVSRTIRQEVGAHWRIPLFDGETTNHSGGLRLVEEGSTAVTLE